jgi:predicted transcriptional regulator
MGNETKEFEMRVEEIMTKNVAVCTTEDSLATAARLMWQRDCGCIPVVAPGDGRSVVAMITDRDICMAAMHQGGTLESLRVSSAMSQDLAACRQDDPIELAVKLLQEKQLHRLAVIGQDDRLCGILSLADVAREAEREHTRPQREVRDFEVAEALEAICAPRDATLQ